MQCELLKAYKFNGFEGQLQVILQYSVTKHYFISTLFIILPNAADSFDIPSLEGPRHCPIKVF